VVTISILAFHRFTSSNNSACLNRFRFVPPKAIKYFTQFKGWFRPLSVPSQRPAISPATPSPTPPPSLSTSPPPFQSSFSSPCLLLSPHPTPTSPLFTPAPFTSPSPHSTPSPSPSFSQSPSSSLSLAPSNPSPSSSPSHPSPSLSQSTFISSSPHSTPHPPPSPLPRKIISTGLILLIGSIWLFFAGCSRSPSTTTLRILHAGSLSVPLKKIAEAFEEKNPQVRLLLESHGSLTCVRQIIDLHYPADVVALSDASLIPRFLMPEYADYTIDFATNELVLMYRPDSPGAEKINADNWMEILLQPEVEFGHSDPNSDPCGYRTLLVWQLAEKYYQQPGLAEKLSQACPPRNIRPKEVDLLALLEAGELDYIFIYLSVARQHGTRFLRLPPEINLGSPRFDEFYRQAAVKIRGKKPGETLLQRGQVMIYGLTIPRNAPFPQRAAELVAFLLSKEGRAILLENGLQPLDPPLVDNPERLPPLLRPLLKVKDKPKETAPNKKEETLFP